MDKRKQTAARGRVGASSKRKNDKAVKAGGAGRAEKAAGRTRKAAVAMFLREVFLALWSLTIVGGIIKNYSYYMVPYIVAENPDLP